MSCARPSRKCFDQLHQVWRYYVICILLILTHLPWTSPGGSSSRLHVYLASVSAASSSITWSYGDHSIGGGLPMCGVFWAWEIHSSKRSIMREDVYLRSPFRVSLNCSSATLLPDSAPSTARHKPRIGLEDKQSGEMSLSSLCTVATMKNITWLDIFVSWQGSQESSESLHRSCLT